MGEDLQKFSLLAIYKKNHFALKEYFYKKCQIFKKR